MGKEQKYKVWAIRYWAPFSADISIVAVSAESEYGAVKRLVSSRYTHVLAVELMPDRKPEHDQRRIEGFCEWAFSVKAKNWGNT